MLSLLAFLGFQWWSVAVADEVLGTSWVHLGIFDIKKSVWLSIFQKKVSCGGLFTFQIVCSIALFECLEFDILFKVFKSIKSSTGRYIKDYYFESLESDIFKLNRTANPSLKKTAHRSLKLDLRFSGGQGLGLCPLASAAFRSLGGLAHTKQPKDDQQPAAAVVAAA